ncbi:MAG: thioredoxin-disulfide reductase [Candidatus Doudnabacteria bacterium]|nr:thioredoxin-disulfide reductase [Candidatus Doudnabacteria bacterium]
MNHHKLIIIGSGPAGLTAAIYAARAELKPLVFAGLTYGGQLMLTTEVENYPGFHKGILGPELMQNFITQAERFGGEIKYEDVTKVDFSRLRQGFGGQAQKPFRVWSGNTEYTADCVIVATGASTMWLNIPSEEKFRGKGISSCATCDGFFFKGKELIVVGGGDSAMEESLYLTKFASKVTIVHRRNEFRASKIMIARVLDNPKISVMWDTVVEEFFGDEKLKSARLKNVKTNEVLEKPIDGAFIAIGHKPNTEIFSGQLNLDAKGYIVPVGDTKTNVEGVFVAGDVRDFRYRQAVTAAGMGCMAAMDAEKYLEMDHG